MAIAVGAGVARLLGGTPSPNRGLKDAAGRNRHTDDDQPDEDQCNSHSHQPSKPELFFGHGSDGSAKVLGHDLLG